MKPVVWSSKQGSVFRGAEMSDEFQRLCVSLNNNNNKKCYRSAVEKKRNLRTWYRDLAFPKMKSMEPWMSQL